MSGDGGRATPGDRVPSGEEDITASRVWVDFNTGGFDEVGADGVRIARPSLATNGSRADIARLGIALERGVDIDIWMDDADVDGRWDPLVGNGTIDVTEAEGWVVQVRLADLCSLSELR